MVDQKDMHADKAIREFKIRNPATEMHISRGIVGESPISPPSNTLPPHPNSPMSHVYYAQAPGQIYAQELEEGLLTYEDATQLCTEKYL